MNAHTYNAPTISAGTITRTAVLLLEQLVTAGCTTVAALVNWWYNNSFTQAALAADEVYEQKKNSVH